ncbi:hypothetical protein CAOG_01242 [Capsaspora owczarzaki ATCC 30864]|uniref:BZIP domain-containing protein n=1 Tax=Capsaspora owczarzaki (strain ATCC 30864) TaxID=595528 RepID=A0A0D2U3M4_CAPO3|nr:hypothetical protein CAOG_01242 [Capsaspora owczarzaki ATCC 30864]KJE89821.1 hypothetical protein CAOG_001242 [Capsaspora owczarzaki ATCC 30864]|eukprot:XP_004349762.1 hypothetical protein CAOG_01242 [Capsaspora owczarzaki ATCC 30864]
MTSLESQLREVDITDDSVLSLLQPSQTAGLDANELMLSLFAPNYPELNLANLTGSIYEKTTDLVTRPLLSAMTVHSLPELHQDDILAAALSPANSTVSSTSSSAIASPPTNGSAPSTVPASGQRFEFDLPPAYQHSSQRRPRSDSSSEEEHHSPESMMRASIRVRLDVDPDEHEDIPGDTALKVKRREQIKRASKLYRERKKRSERQLEDELDRLRKEKDELFAEKERALLQLRVLQNNTSTHANAGVNHASDVEQSRLRLLALLKQVSQDPTATDEQLLQVIRPLRDTCRVVSGIAICHAQHLLSMRTSLSLASTFLNDCMYLVETEKSAYGLGAYARQVRHAVPSMSQTQIQLLNTITEQYYSDIAILHAERKQLARDLDAHALREKQQPDVMLQSQIMLSRLTLIDCLRRNIHAEVNLFEFAIDQIVSMLSPRQQAQLLSQIDLQHTSVLMLSGLQAGIRAQQQQSPAE